MAVLDAIPVLRDLRESEKSKPPQQVQDRLKRGRARMVEGASSRNECLRFWKNDQYVYVNTDGYLLREATSSVVGTDGARKARHTARTTRNMIVDVVAHEVSAATQRVPGYEVSPSSTAPDRRSAALLAEKVAIYGYDKWKVALAVEDVVTYAVVADEGFAWPIFDNTIGPFIDDGQGGSVGQGEIRVRIFGPNEVYWEPGINFEDSRWHAIEQARPLDEIYEMPGYIGGKLRPDADTSDVRDSRAGSNGKNLALVTEYLERPSIKNPRGSWRVIADKREIVPARPFPCLDGKGRPVDEPVLHGLAYFRDPSSDRDLGLVRFVLDAQRTINDTTNKQLEWKNLALMPQWATTPNNFARKQRRTDEPGAIFVLNSLSPENFKLLDTPQIPRDLQELKDEARADMGRIAAQNDPPSQVESGKGLIVLNEKDAARRTSFIARLADFHSRLMRHCLYLVQRHYTEPRLLKISGPFGPTTQEFRGADLKSEVDVRVLPGSIEPLTKEGLLMKIKLFAELFPGQFSFEQAMAAVDGGSTESLDQGYTLQREKQQREIQQMLALSPTLSPTAQPEDYLRAGVPIPIPADNDTVHLDVLHQFEQTEEFDNLPDPVKNIITAHDQAHQMQQREKAAEAAQAQLEQAQSLGMGNAAKPQTPPAAPSSPMPA